MLVRAEVRLSLSRLIAAIVLGSACAPAPGARERSMVNPLQRDAGAIEIVPAVHFPQPADGSVRVWLSLPEGSTLGVEEGADGRLGFTYPPGTVADRVEILGQGDEQRVVDIRGTSIDDDGRAWHHVYRPTRRNPRAPLVGAEWLADDPALQARGSALLLSQLREGGVTGDLGGIAAKLDCDGCHREGRPDNARVGEYGLVARGTDGAGFFTPSTLLARDVPLERYGAVDPNRGDRFVVARCADGSPQAARGGCADGSVPRASLTLEAALAAGDAHALAHCATWRALAPFLPDEVAVPVACEVPS